MGFRIDDPNLKVIVRLCILNTRCSQHNQTQNGALKNNSEVVHAEKCCFERIIYKIARMYEHLNKVMQLFEDASDV